MIDLGIPDVKVLSYTVQCPSTYMGLGIICVIFMVLSAVVGAAATQNISRYWRRMVFGILLTVACSMGCTWAFSHSETVVKATAETFTAWEKVMKTYRNVQSDGLILIITQEGDLTHAIR